MGSLRLVAWNCQNGSLNERLSDLVQFTPDLAFLQECRPGECLPLIGQSFLHRVNPTKAIAVASLNPKYALTELEPRAVVGRAAIGVQVSGPVSFAVVGVWSQAPRYVDDVLQKLRTYSEAFRSGPVVVMGDMNSGTNLGGDRSVSEGHRRLIEAMRTYGLVSAYHTFHSVEHGHERDATYHHQFKASQPWHIDFCFVPWSWAAALVDVRVAVGDGRTQVSDHRPLIVEIDCQRIPAM